MNNDLQKRVEDLERFVNALKSPDTMPSEFDRSIQYRYMRVLPSTQSAKSSTSENVSINEGGSTTHTVLGNPDGFIKVTINNIDYYLPYYA